MSKSAYCLLPFLVGIGAATSSFAAPAMWEVRDDDSAIWLFGSFHVLPENLQWRTELFDRTLTEADAIVFEADIGPSAMAEIGAKAFARGIFMDGTLLTDLLDEETEQRLRDVANSISLPVGSLLAMKPWFAANTISIGAMAAQGFTVEGVEFVLQPEIAANRQIYLESGDQQLDVLAGASDAEQIAMLETTLEEIETLPKSLGKLTSNWVEGTPENLGDLFLSELGGFEDAFLERLIYARNRNWMTPIEAMLAQNDETLVIVGAAHLIGDGSMLDLLEQAGYEIERIQ